MREQQWELVALSNEINKLMRKQQQQQQRMWDMEIDRKKGEEKLSIYRHQGEKKKLCGHLWKFLSLWTIE